MVMGTLLGNGAKLCGCCCRSTILSFVLEVAVVGYELVGPHSLCVGVYLGLQAAMFWLEPLPDPLNSALEEESIRDRLCEGLSVSFGACSGCKTGINCATGLDSVV